jgi:hypothetical protein
MALTLKALRPARETQTMPMIISTVKPSSLDLAIFAHSLFLANLAV